MKISGIYSIAHTTSGRCYIGQASDVSRRWRDHKLHLRKGSHHSRKLQEAWLAHGAAAFTFRVLEAVAVERLNERELFWVTEMQPALNMRVDCIKGAARGWHQSDEAKKKIALASTGRLHSDKAKAAIADFRRTDPAAIAQLAKLQASKRGVPRSPETIAKMRAAKVGFRHKPETIEKLKAVAASSTYRHSAETRARISAAGKGRRLSAEATARMRAALTGRTLSPQHRKNIGDATRGKSRPPEVVARVADAIRMAHAERKAAGTPQLRNRRRKDAKLSPLQIQEIKAAWVPRARGGRGRKTNGPTIMELATQHGVSYLTAWKAAHSTFEGMRA